MDYMLQKYKNSQKPQKIQGLSWNSQKKRIMGTGFDPALCFYLLLLNVERFPVSTLMDVLPSKC